MAGGFRHRRRLTALLLPLARTSFSNSTWLRKGCVKDSNGGPCIQPGHSHPGSPRRTLSASLPLQFPWQVTFKRLHGRPPLLPPTPGCCPLPQVTLALGRFGSYNNSRNMGRLCNWNAMPKGIKGVVPSAQGWGGVQSWAPSRHVRAEMTQKVKRLS